MEENIQDLHNRFLVLYENILQEMNNPSTCPITMNQNSNTKVGGFFENEMRLLGVKPSGNIFFDLINIDNHCKVLTGMGLVALSCSSKRKRNGWGANGGKINLTKLKQIAKENNIKITKKKDKQIVNLSKDEIILKLKKKNLI